MGTAQVVLAESCPANQYLSLLLGQRSRTDSTTFDENEDLEIHFLTVQDIDEQIANGEFLQGNHIAAFLLARSHLLAMSGKPE